MILLSQELASGLERAEIDYMIDRMTAVQERPGNPMGVEMRAFGGATAFYSKAMPWPQFNTVKGLSADEMDCLDDIIHFYKERNGTGQFEIIPSKASGELLQALHDKGWYASGFHATLFSDTSSVLASLPASFAPEDIIEVRQLSGEDIDLYAALHCLGTGLPISGKHHVAENNIVLMERPGWHFYAAFVQGVPAGAAVMHVRGAAASFTFAAVLPEFRRRGAHAALLARRIQDASASHGCRLVVSQAAYASASFRNMERCGLRLAYTRAAWKQA